MRSGVRGETHKALKPRTKALEVTAARQGHTLIELS